jgi:hypothetical protein
MRRHGGFSHNLVTEIQTKGCLPTEAGVLAAWSRVRRSEKPAPIIPGVQLPTTIDRRLLKVAVLSDGALKLPTFKLDEFLGDKDFSNVTVGGRQRFFDWLRTTHRDLKPRTLVTIATYPIWPGADGQHRRLDYYCWPKSRSMRSLLSETMIEPAEEVITFPGLRRSAKGALRLRDRPAEPEMQGWHASRMAKITVALNEGQPAQAHRLLKELETELERLRGEGNWPIPRIAQKHLTFDKAGDLKPVAGLHAATPSVTCCGLLAEDVTAGGFAHLYLALGASARPSGPALLRALRQDPDQALLFRRLEAYRALSRALSDLKDEPIIRVGEELHAPGTLSLPSTTNWWGQWKTSLERQPEIPQHIDLLEKTGVVRQALREELSREFFAWLSGQSKNVQCDHIQQVIRHWGERRHGPSRWIERYPGLACIPTQGPDQSFALLSRDQAVSAKAKVFLPDFPELQEQIIQSGSAVRLVIVGAKGVSGSVIDVMREVGVPSLRQLAGRPSQLQPMGEIGRDPILDGELAKIQSRSIRQALMQRLPHFDVPLNALQREWRKYLFEIAETRISSRLTAIFRILRREYKVEVTGGIDAATGLLYVVRHSDRLLEFYKILAGHIFHSDSNPLFAFGLLQAVRNRQQLPLFEYGPDEEGADDLSPEESSANGLPAHEPPSRGHGIAPHKRSPIVPDPSPLADISDVTKPSGHKGHPPSRRSKSSTEDRRRTVEEEEQKRQLKERHYGYHCQACLGEYDVLTAAPPRSYVYLPAFRQKIIDAHHVEHLQNAGDIGAKNLLILCKYHHEVLGDRLSRNQIFDALSNAQKVIRAFPGDESGTVLARTEGLLATLSLDVEPFSARLFFTQQHAMAWRSEEL